MPDRCDIAGGIVGYGINTVAAKAGLNPFPLGSGEALELNPGFPVQRELSLLCKDNPGESIFNLDLKALTAVTQAYLIDRMRTVASEQQDKKLGIPGQRIESPSFGLGFIGLKGEGTVVLWRDPSKEGIDQLNGVLSKFTFFGDSAR
jgi:hypothetical protein